MQVDTFGLDVKEVALTSMIYSCTDPYLAPFFPRGNPGLVAAHEAQADERCKNNFPPLGKQVTKCHSILE